MKKITTLLLALLFTATTFTQVGIGTTTPNASSALDISATTKGLLLPRMTAIERDAISSPAQGLIIFCKNCASGEGELQIRLTSSWKNLHNGGDVNDPPPPAVGDFYGGGVVFYLFEAGDTGYVAGETHGLIAAVEDTSDGIIWYNGSWTTTGATGTVLGTGQANTNAIIANQGATETDYAAGLARAYRGGGYTDWFLPSKDELNLMYTNKATINTTAAANGGSNFTIYTYWSSTEYDNYLAWKLTFSSGYLGFNGGKYSTFAMRAVRAF
jgi:hypothetical protein